MRTWHVTWQHQLFDGRGNGMNSPSLVNKLTMLTLEQAASLLLLSTEETIQLADSGRIRCFRLGQQGDVLRFIRLDVDSFLAANQTVRQATGER